MKCIINNNKIFERYVWFALTVIIICLLIIVYRQLDGVKIKPVITFTQDFDPSNVQLDKSEYRAGETVYMLASFCKKRNALGGVQWSLVNDRIEMYSPKVPEQQLPVGCYPEDQDRFIPFPIEKIAEGTTIGEHYFVGVGTNILPNGKVINKAYKTETFNVIK